MDSKIQKYVDDGLFTEEIGNYIQKAFDNKESVIIAGHRSTGSRPLIANLMAVAKGQYDAVQVRKAEDLEKEGDYYLVFGPPADQIEGLISQVIAKEKPFVTLKEPETPFSIMKIFKGYVKENPETKQVIHQVSLKKDGTGSDATPYTDRVDRYFVNEKQKVKSEKVYVKE